MRVYIAGPMTGIEHYNVKAFNEAADFIAGDDQEVWTPFDSNNVVWQRHFKRDFDPICDKCDYGDPLLGEMVGENLKALASCQEMALLPGWENSKGSKLEIHLATLLRIPIYSAISGAPLDIALSVHAFENTR